MSTLQYNLTAYNNTTMMKTKYIYFLLLLLCLAGCNNVPGLNLNQKENIEGKHNIKVDSVIFSKDYKTISLMLNLPDVLATYSLNDTVNIHVRTEEECPSYLNEHNNVQPQLVKIENIRQQELANSKFCLLLLIDLTLPEDQIATEKRAVEVMRKWFSPTNLHIAFMKDKGVTEDFLVTDYVMDNYFKPSNSQKFLYRSVLQKMDEIRGWQSLDIGQKGMIVFSDGDVYANNYPIDPNHFDLQKKLLAANRAEGYSSVYYINVGQPYGEDEDDEAQPVLQHLCDRTDGISQQKFDWNALLTDILSTFHMSYSDYRLDFVNPDGKEYTGKTMHLHVNVYDSSKLLGTACASYNIGNIYSPVIIEGLSLTQVLIIGLIVTLVILAVVYIVLQIVVPFVSYRFFKRKYVTHYTNQSMVLNGIQVNQSCYYCKAPFVEGDEIVVKCKHAMHKSCWEENDYKCPEYGRRCKEGSHYYNANALWNIHNAPFVTSWVLMAFVGAFLGWVSFLLYSDNYSSPLLYKIMLVIMGLKDGTSEAQAAYDVYAAHLKYLPIFGLCHGFFLCLCLSLLATRRYPVATKLKAVFLKSCCSALLGYLIFLLTCVVSIAVNLREDSIMVDWIPWAAMGFVVSYIATFGTRIYLKRKFIAISVLIGLVVMYMWMYFVFYNKMDCREQLLLCFLVYDVAISVSIAAVAPRSERYFLHVEGAIKPMDIALYKWLRTSPDYRVTIGKSVDCYLQMSWDLSADIAPVAAVIYAVSGKPYLEAVEECVTVDGKVLVEGKRIRLYHGRKFMIGKTLFTYVEKDIA